jgi:hypothetical protein
VGLGNSDLIDTVKVDLLPPILARRRDLSRLSVFVGVVPYSNGASIEILAPRHQLGVL